jgi:hypothetical protein
MWLVNWDQIEGKWKERKGRFGENWGKLTDRGTRHVLIERLGESHAVAPQHTMDGRAPEKTRVGLRVE